MEEGGPPQGVRRPCGVGRVGAASLGKGKKSGWGAEQVQCHAPHALPRGAEPKDRAQGACEGSRAPPGLCSVSGFPAPEAQ